ncbi:MAG TPA: thioredoxin family protein [Xanthobacteraceae bacterium]|nr:thioredoxin family protein [Xanthobacteraceae bacterium]
MTQHTVVSHDAWLAARKALLAREKAFTRARDELSRARRDLPWERVEKDYRFAGPGGEVGLADLFAGRSQLVVYHLMFDPAWDAACKSCSFWADNFERNVVHLAHRDVTMIAISRAPLAKIEAFRRRMGWTFDWYSSNGSDFNYDYGVSFRPDEVGNGKAAYNFGTIPPPGSEMPGISVFYKDDAGAIFRTYSCYSRGIEMMNAAYQYLDLVPKGRDEDPARPMSWLRLRDTYGA